MILPPRTCGDSGGVKANGEPCGMNVPVGGQLCPLHDPAMAEEMKRRRAKGNASRGTLAITAKAAEVRGVPSEPKNLEDATTFAAWAVHQVASGQLDPRVGHEIGFILNSFRGALEKRDLLREIESLRRDLAAARKETPKAVLGLQRG